MTEVTPLLALLVFSTVHVNTEWERLDSLFSLVSPVCLFSAPCRIKVSTSSTLRTSVSVRYSTKQPCVSSRICRFVAEGFSRSVMVSL